MEYQLVDICGDKVHFADKHFRFLAVDNRGRFGGVQQIVVEHRVGGKLFSGVLHFPGSLRIRYVGFAVARENDFDGVPRKGVFVEDRESLIKVNSGD